MTDPDPITIQTKQQELETAIAVRKKAEAELEEALAKATTAKAAAQKAQNEVAGDLELDPDVVAARKDARLAELAKEQAASDEASRKSALPAVPTLASISAETDKSPKVETDAGNGTATMVAATALDITGQEIGRAVRAKLTDPATIWIVDYLDVARRRLERDALSARLDAFYALLAPVAGVAKTSGEPKKEAVEELGVGGAAAGEIASFGLGLGTGIAKFGVELVGALRSRYAFYGRKVDLNRSALVASVLRALGNPPDAQLTVRWPTLAAAGDSSLITRFADACMRRDEYAARYVLPEVPADDKNAKARQDYAKAILASFDAFATSITAAPEAGAPSELVAAALFDLAVPLVDGAPQNYFLQIDITEQGADAILGYGLVHGTQASFLGFVQAYYLLAKPDGTIVAGGTITNRKVGKVNVKDGKVDFDSER